MRLWRRRPLADSLPFEPTQRTGMVPCRHASGYARRLFMPQRHPSIDLIAHAQGQSPGYGCASSDGRYQAALVGT
jgi:hypothetical protein